MCYSEVELKKCQHRKKRELRGAHFRSEACAEWFWGGLKYEKAALE